MAPRPPDFERIQQALRDTRTRLRRRALLTSALWTVAALGLAFLVLVGLAQAVSGGRGFRFFAWTALIAGAGALLWRHLIRPWRGSRADASVAHHLERGLPGLKDGLISSVQFSGEWGSAQQQSPGLVAALADQVATHLADVNLRAQTPLLPSRRPLYAALGTSAIWLLVALIGPAWLGQGLGRLLPARTQDGARLVGPLVGDLELTLVYPEHMKRPDRLIPNSMGDFEAPKGTQVQIRATTLQPARSVALRFASGGAEGGPMEVPLTLADGRDALGRFTVTQAGRWRFAVVSEDGENQAEAVERMLRLEPDNPPTVNLTLPTADAEIDDLRPIRVEFDATDDYGLSKAAVLLTLEADADHPERIEQPAVSGKRLVGGEEIDLTRIQAAGGDRIGISVEVFDNNVVDGPQRSVSTTRWLTIHSPQKKHTELMEKLNGLVEAFVTALADRLELDLRAVETGDVKLAPAKDRVQAVITATEEPAKTLAEIVTAMKDDALTPKEVHLALAGRLGELEKALRAEKVVLGAQSAGLDAKQDNAIRTVSRANEGSIERVEQTIVLIEALVARLALEELMALTDEIKSSTQRLKDLLQEYKRAPSDALKQRIRRDIQRLKARIQEIRERIAKLRQKLPEEFLNMEGLKDDEVNKGLEKTQEQLDNLDKMLDENRLDDAMKALEEMEASLDELSNQLNQDMEDLHQETNPEMQKAISELMDQTRDLMKDQQQLNEATDQALKEYEECLQRILTVDLAAPFAALKEKGARMRGFIEQMDPSQVPSYMSSEIDDARQRVDQLNAALARPELMDAVEMAERLLDSVETIERSVRMAGMVPGEPTKGALAQGRALAREMSRDAAGLLRNYDALKKRECDKLQRPVAMPSPQENGQPQPGEDGQPQPQPGEPGQGQPQPQPGDGQTPGQRQRQVAEGTRRLRQRIGDKGQMIPGMPPQLGQSAENAAQAMDRAAGDLDKQRPGDARPSQQQAMNELQGIMDGLKQAASPQRADRGGKDEGGQRGISRKKIEIPGAEEHESPQEFRKDLLDAMKDKAPEEYQEQVKRYYESLVQ